MQDKINESNRAHLEFFLKHILRYDSGLIIVLGHPVQRLEAEFLVIIKG